MSSGLVAGVVNKPSGYAQYASLASVVKLTDPPVVGQALPNWSIRALIQPEGGDARWRDDATDPATGQGMILKDGIVLEYEGDLTRIRFIGTSAVKLNVLYYKY